MNFRLLGVAAADSAAPQFADPLITGLLQIDVSAGIRAWAESAVPVLGVSVPLAAVQAFHAQCSALWIAGSGFVPHPYHPAVWEQDALLNALVHSAQMWRETVNIVRGAAEIGARWQWPRGAGQGQRGAARLRARQDQRREERAAADRLMTAAADRIVARRVRWRLTESALIAALLVPQEAATEGLAVLAELKDRFAGEPVPCGAPLPPYSFSPLLLPGNPVGQLPPLGLEIYDASS